MDAVACAIGHYLFRRLVAFLRADEFKRLERRKLHVGEILRIVIARVCPFVALVLVRLLNGRAEKLIDLARFVCDGAAKNRCPNTAGAERKYGF